MQMNFTRSTVCLLGCMAVVLFFPGCRNSQQNNSSNVNSNQLIIFHAGSLSIPVKEMVTAFNKTHPDIKIITESAGSVACARKITDLNKPCDVLLSADYQVIDNFMIPQFADWNIRFASNKMVLVFTEKSKYSHQINLKNWPEILLRKDVFYGRSDPNSDPCGYRTVISLKLAGKYLSQSDLADEILEKDQRFIRPKEVDLVALLQSNAIDYVFIYQSVALQHQLPYLNLPDSVDLGNPLLADWYASASTKIDGNKPGETTIQKGEPMVYGLTIPKNSPNPQMALEFVKFILSPDGGMKIMEKNGQPSLIPAFTNTYYKLPESLRPFALSN